jgi:hypothetical protein
MFNSALINFTWATDGASYWVQVNVAAVPFLCKYYKIKLNEYERKAQEVILLEKINKFAEEL